MQRRELPQVHGVHAGGRISMGMTPTPTMCTVPVLLEPDKVTDTFTSSSMTS